MTDLRAGELVVRVCDVCGKESYTPVRLATRCGGFTATDDATVLCHGHCIKPVIPDEASQ